MMIFVTAVAKEYSIFIFRNTGREGTVIMFFCLQM